MASPITTHVLDTAAGRPAAGIRVELEFLGPEGWQGIGEGVTDSDGRIGDLLGGPAARGTYRLTFFVRTYLESQARPGFYPQIPIVFEVSDPGDHYHVPLLLSPWGYSTYRGS